MAGADVARRAVALGPDHDQVGLQLLGRVVQAASRRRGRERVGLRSHLVGRGLHPAGVGQLLLLIHERPVREHADHGQVG